jgi:hypothetical protein
LTLTSEDVENEDGAGEASLLTSGVGDRLNIVIWLSFLASLARVDRRRGGGDELYRVAASDSSPLELGLGDRLGMGA